MELRGKVSGFAQLSVTPDFQDIAAQIPVELNDSQWRTVRGGCTLPTGKRTLYFRFAGSGSVDFLSFTLS